MDRRRFVLSSLASAGALGAGIGIAVPASAAPAQPGDSPYGPLLDPDANGLRLPEGFTSRVIKQFGQPIGPSTTPARAFPDGSATFPADGGGWILVSNSENPPPADITDPLDTIDRLGGCQAIVFAADGTVTDAYDILTGTRSNCSGGATPWGTWLSCEELDDPRAAANSGAVYECDPATPGSGVERPALGYFKHENVAVDPVRERLYQSEDLPDGLYYRFTPAAYPDLTAGVLEAAAVAADGSVAWVEVPDPTCTGGVPCRQQATGATPFDGGEGCVYHDGKVFLTTKGDDRVWVHDVVAETMTVLYDAADFPEPVLTGVDHIIVQPGTGHLVVAEDGGDLEAVMITVPDFRVFPILQMTGPEHGAPLPGPLGAIPTTSEVSGLAFNPAGDRLYFNSQRHLGFGITYEVQGPWLEQGLGGPADTTTSSPPTTAVATASGSLPATGGGGLSPLAVGAAGAAAALVALRRRVRADS